MLKKICLMILVLFYAVGIFSFLVNFQSTEDFSLSRSEVKESSTNVQKDDVIIPDEEKVSWQTVFENYVTEQQALDANFTYPVQGNGTQANPYQISNVMDLAYFQNIIEGNRTYALSKWFSLTNDIVLNDGYFEEDGTYHDGGDGFLYEWNSINLRGMEGAKFYGNGHTISGLYKNALFYSKNYSSAKRDTISSIDFRDFTVKNAYVNETSIIFPMRLQSSKFENINCYGYLISDSANDGYDYAVGGIFGCLYVYCTATNCSNYALVNHITWRNTGGLVGMTYNTKISNCANYGNISGTSQTGGIVGKIESGSIINCKNEGAINCSGANLVGGIAGYYTSPSEGQMIISNCVNSGNIEARVEDGSSAGIVGRMDVNGNRGNAIISNCVNKGSIIGVAGIVGSISISNPPEDKHSIALIDGCINHGELVDCQAGIAGGTLPGYVTIQNCVNYSDISSVSSDDVGGICYSFTSYARIVDCCNYGNVYGRMRCGGILAGYKQGNMYNSEIIGCVNKGRVMSSGNKVCFVGGIVGIVSHCRDLKIAQCRNEGTIIGNNSSGNIGGIVGFVSGNSGHNPEIEICKTQNIGKVVTRTSAVSCAGILGGSAFYATVVLEECVNDGEIKSIGVAQGLFFANYNVNKRLVIVNCANRGKITSSNGAVYAIGNINSDSTYIENCYSSGEVQGNNATANYFVSGIDASQIKNCLYFGTGVSAPKYYGTDFSGFYCNRLTGEIGLRRLNSRGLFDAVANETLLQNNGFTKVA